MQTFETMTRKVVGAASCTSKGPIEEVQACRGQRPSGLVRVQLGFTTTAWRNEDNFIIYNVNYKVAEQAVFARNSCAASY